MQPRTPLTPEQQARRQVPASPAFGTPEWQTAFADSFNRKVMAEHEQDLARLPPEVRASKTPEQWLATPPLEILKLAGEARQG